MSDSFSLDSINTIRRASNGSSRLQVDSFDLTTSFAQVFEAAAPPKTASRDRAEPKIDDSRPAPAPTQADDGLADSDDAELTSAAAQANAAAIVPQAVAVETVDGDAAVELESVAAADPLADQVASGGEDSIAEEAQTTAAAAAIEETEFSEAAVTVDSASVGELATEAPVESATPIASDQQAETGEQSPVVNEPELAEVEAVEQIDPLVESEPETDPARLGNDLPNGQPKPDPVAEESAAVESASEELEPAIARAEVALESPKAKRSLDNQEPGKERVVGLTAESSTSNSFSGDGDAIVKPVAAVQDLSAGQELAGQESAAQELAVQDTIVDPIASIEATPVASPSETASQPAAVAVPAAASKSVDAARSSNAAPVDAAPSVGSTKAEPAGSQTAGKATAPEASKLDLVDRARLLQRVSRAFQQLGTDGGSLKIRLHPPRLGSVGIDVNVSGKKINARIVTESEAASHALRENLHDLKNRLAEQGFQIESIEISTESESGTWQGGQKEQSESFRNFVGQPRQNRPALATAAETTTESQPAANLSTTSLDLVA